MSDSSRRTFLKQTAAAAGVSAAYALTGAPLAYADSAAARRRPMRYSMCNETFQGWPQDKIFKFCAECGYEAIEIAPFTINTDVTQIDAGERRRLRKQADKANVRIVGLHWLLAKTKGLHLTSPDPEVRRKTTEYLGELARFCHDLGGDVMVFGSPKQRNILPGVSRDQARSYAAEVLKDVMPTLDKLGVILALEPLAPKTTDFMTTAAEGIELAEMVDSANCKLLLDCNAMHSEPTPIPDLIRKHGTWLVHFHANDPNRRGPGMGDLDFAPIFQALYDIHYTGWVSVEVFDYSPGAETLAGESIKYMRAVEARLNS